MIINLAKTYLLKSPHKKLAENSCKYDVVNENNGFVGADIERPRNGLLHFNVWFQT